MCRNVQARLAADPARARFLSQVEASPYSRRAHELSLSRDPLLEASRDSARYTIDLPMELPWDQAFGRPSGLPARSRQRAAGVIIGRRDAPRRRPARPATGEALDVIPSG